MVEHYGALPIGVGKIGVLVNATDVGLGKPPGVGVFVTEIGGSVAGPPVGVLRTVGVNVCRGVAVVVGEAVGVAVVVGNSSRVGIGVAVDCE